MSNLIFLVSFSHSVPAGSLERVILRHSTHNDRRFLIGYLISEHEKRVNKKTCQSVLQQRKSLIKKSSNVFKLNSKSKIVTSGGQSKIHLEQEVVGKKSKKTTNQQELNREMIGLCQPYGTLTKKLLEIWRQTAVAASSINNVANNDQVGTMVSNVQSLFHRIDLYPTESQVFEMIQCVNRCNKSNRASINNNHHQKNVLTFGEFCFFASVLIRGYKQSSVRSAPSWLDRKEVFSRHFDRVNQLNSNSKQQQQQCNTIESDHQTKFDVFLGGSCNPTNWRREMAIPELKRQGISFYNPQVDHWGPELIELENYAKQNSEVMFFVIDNQTRAIASMIEVAFIAACNQRKLIVVIDDLDWPECKITHELLTIEESQSLRKARNYLRDVVERQGIPIFNQLTQALKATIKVVKENIFPQNLPPSDKVKPTKMGHLSLGDKMIKVFTVFDTFKNPQTKDFTFAELPLAYRTLTGHELPSKLVEKLARCHLAIDQQEQDSCVNEDRVKSIPGRNLVRKLKKSLSSSSSSTECETDSAATNSNQQQQQHLKSSVNSSFSKVGEVSHLAMEKVSINFDQFCMIISELDQKFFNQPKTNVKRQGKPSECFVDDEGDLREMENVQHETNLFRNNSSIIHYPNRFLNKFVDLLSIIKSILFNNSMQQSSDRSNYEKKQQQQQQQNQSTLPIFHKCTDIGDASLHQSLYHHQVPEPSMMMVNTHSKLLFNSNLVNLSTSPHQQLPPIENNEFFKSSQSLNNLAVMDYHNFNTQNLSRHQCCSTSSSSSIHQSRNRKTSLMDQKQMNYYCGSYKNSPISSISPARHSFLAANNWNHSSLHHHHDQALFRRASSAGANTVQKLASSNVYQKSFNDANHQQKSSTPLMFSSSSSSSLSTSITSLLYENVHDLYIGGCFDSKLFQDLIIPLLKKHSITYCTPKFDKFAQERMIPLEMRNIERSRCLLFFISKDSIDVSSMVMAAYYLGLGFRVVLCIQYIDPVQSELASKFSAEAVKDHNRGRSYLSDFATKFRVPVFDQIDEALGCCIRECSSE